MSCFFLSSGWLTWFPPGGRLGFDEAGFLERILAGEPPLSRDVPGFQGVKLYTSDSNGSIGVQGGVSYVSPIVVRNGG